MQSDIIFKHLSSSAIEYLSFKMPSRVVHLDVSGNVKENVF